jgi:hypothetical protein
LLAQKAIAAGVDLPQGVSDATCRQFQPNVIGLTWYYLNCPHGSNTFPGTLPGAIPETLFVQHPIDGIDPYQPGYAYNVDFPNFIYTPENLSLILGVSYSRWPNVIWLSRLARKDLALTLSILDHVIVGSGLQPLVATFRQALENGEDLVYIRDHVMSLDLNQFEVIPKNYSALLNLTQYRYLEIGTQIGSPSLSDPSAKKRWQDWVDRKIPYFPICLFGNRPIRGPDEFRVWSNHHGATEIRQHCSDDSNPIYFGMLPWGPWLIPPPWEGVPPPHEPTGDPPPPTQKDPPMPPPWIGKGRDDGGGGNGDSPPEGGVTTPGPRDPCQPRPDGTFCPPHPDLNTADCDPCTSTLSRELLESILEDPLSSLQKRFDHQLDVLNAQQAELNHLASLIGIKDTDYGLGEDAGKIDLSNLESRIRNEDERSHHTSFLKGLLKTLKEYAGTLQKYPEVQAHYQRLSELLESIQQGIQEAHHQTSALAQSKSELDPLLAQAIQENTNCCDRWPDGEPDLKLNQLGKALDQALGPALKMFQDTLFLNLQAKIGLDASLQLWYLLDLQHRGKEAEARSSGILSSLLTGSITSQIRQTLDDILTPEGADKLASILAGLVSQQAPEEKIREALTTALKDNPQYMAKLGAEMKAAEQSGTINTFIETLFVGPIIDKLTDRGLLMFVGSAAGQAAKGAFAAILAVVSFADLIIPRILEIQAGLEYGTQSNMGVLLTRVFYHALMANLYAAKDLLAHMKSLRDGALDRLAQRSLPIVLCLPKSNKGLWDTLISKYGPFARDASVSETSGPGPNPSFILKRKTPSGNITLEIRSPCYCGKLTSTIPETCPPPTTTPIPTSTGQTTAGPQPASEPAPTTESPPTASEPALPPSTGGDATAPPPTTETTTQSESSSTSESSSETSPSSTGPDTPGATENPCDSSQPMYAEVTVDSNVFAGEIQPGDNAFQVDLASLGYSSYGLNANIKIRSTQTGCTAHYEQVDITADHVTTGSPTVTPSSGDSPLEVAMHVPEEASGTYCGIVKATVRFWISLGGVYYLVDFIWASSCGAG